MTRRPPTPVGLDAQKVADALRAADGSPTHAARLLGVGRGTVIYWMRKSGIRREVAIVHDETAAS